MSRKAKAIILLIVILIGVLGLISSCNKSAEVSEAKEDKYYTPVQVERVTARGIEDKVKINGKIFANEEIIITSKVPGVVTSVNVELGDVVKEGSVLFIIEQEDISKNLEQTANAVEIASNGVAQAENALKTALVNYELTQEKIDNAKLNLDRTRKLYEEGAVPKSQVEQAELAASEKSLEVAKGQVKQAEIAYEQALNQLRQSEISYEQMASNLDDTVIRAPRDGVISELNVKEGQIATGSQIAAKIVDIDKVYIQINVVENIVNRLEVGQEVNIKVPAAFDEEITSTISYISPTADDSSQLYPVKIYIDNLDRKLKPGMNGEVDLSIDEVESTIVLKGDAVLDKDDRNIVFVLEDDKAVERTVVLGLDTGEYVEIKEGLKEGEQVIVKGQHYVEDGGKVKVVRGE